MCRAQCVLVVALFVGLVQSWDIAISARDRLEFYTGSGTKINTVRFTSQNLAALVYDEIHNMLLYVDKQNDNDAICGYSISYGEYKCYVERNGRNIQGLTFDPVSETLFFTDIKERSINWFSFKPGFTNNFYGNLLIKMDDGIPTDIAVDSCRGYIYWINTNLPRSRIERARFDGSDREVVIYADYRVDQHDLHSLVIDQLNQKVIWLMPVSSSNSYTYSADLNGGNKKRTVAWRTGEYNIHPNSYTFSKHYLYAVGCTSCPTKHVWRHSKPINNQHTKIIHVHTAGVVGIAANYKMKDQFQGISDCRHALNNYETDDSIIAKEYEGPYCAHGTKVNGQSLCKCTLGYTGDRCDVSVCENYCLHGNCSLAEQGLPTCRCEAGYSGERCEVNVCHGYCSNSGTCSLDDDSQPICQYQGGYVGHKCEISGCLNHCLNGNCTLNEQGLPRCRCEAGYSGERCEVTVCHGYCSNNATCYLNEEDEPFCDCVGEYEGDRCEVPKGLKNCDGSLNKENQPACQCDSSTTSPLNHLK